MSFSKEDWLEIINDCHITDRLFSHAPGNTDNVSVGDARECMRAAMERQRAVTCPCCGFEDKIVYSVLKPDHGKALLYTANQHMKGERWLKSTDTQNWLARNKDGHGWTNYYVNSLVNWGLVERANNFKYTQMSGSSYEYRLTRKGQEFILGKISVPKVMMIQQKFRVCGRSDTEVSFEELMDGYDLSRFCNDVYHRLQDKPVLRGLTK